MGPLNPQLFIIVMESLDRMIFALVPFFWWGLGVVFSCQLFVDAP